MAKGVHERIRQAGEAGAEELGFYVHDPSARVIRALLANGNIGEQEILIIAARKDLPGDIFEAIAKNKRWAENYPIRITLAKNPKTPLFIALSISRYLRLFDLAEISRNPSLSLVFRHKVENIIVEKVPTMPLGIKRSLAKRAAPNVLSILVRDKDPDVVRASLDNPRLVEADLIRAVMRRDSALHLTRSISEHPKWSSRYFIRLALVRNSRTPLSASIQFLGRMMTKDLKELYADHSVPSGIKPYIHCELMERHADIRTDGPEHAIIYEIIAEEASESDSSENETDKKNH